MRTRPARRSRCVLVPLLLPPLLSSGCLVRHVPRECELTAPRVEVPNFASSVLDIYVTIDGGEERNFLLDTGGTTFILDEDLADEIGLRSGASWLWRIDGPYRHRWEWRRSARLPEIRIGDGVVIRGTGCALAPGPGGYDGVLGNGLLEHVTIEISADRRTLTLSRERLSPAPGDIPIRFRRGLPWVEVRALGRSVRAVLDTGHWGGLHLPESWEDDVAIVTPDPDGGTVRTVPDRLETGAEIGGRPFERPRVGFGTGDPLVGLSTFCGRSVTIDLRSRILRLGPAEAPAPPRDP